MTIEIGVALSVLVAVLTVLTFVFARNKDAEERGALRQRVADLEKRADKVDAKMDKILEKLDTIVKDLTELLADHRNFTCAGRDQDIERLR